MDKLKVIIAAAGSASRMQSELNKQYMLLDDKPVLFYAINTFCRMPQVEEIVVVAHPDEVNYCSQNVVAKYNLSKVTKVIAGGASRQESVSYGLTALGSNTAYVAIHDGARPLVREADILECFSNAITYGAAILGVFATNTMKLVDEDNLVVKTIDRSKLVAAQTPQIFDYAKLVEAYKLAKLDGFKATDDASVYEKYQGQVKLVVGDNRNIKITHSKDIGIAEELLLDFYKERV